MRFARSRAFAAICLSMLVAFCLCIDAARASKVRPVNLEEMTDRAAVIFSGRCTDVRVAEDPVVGTVTLTTFEVTRAVKGDVRETVTVKSLGGQPVGLQRGGDVPGMPRFSRDEEVILFLYGESSLGLSSPVALGQGKFTVYADKAGRKVALNTMSNDRLLAGLSSSALQRLGPSLEQVREIDDLAPDTLLNMVRVLID